MFGRAYYSLVAGLRDWTLDSDVKGFDARAIIDEVAAQLSAGDLRAMRLLYTFYDIENIISLRSGRSARETLGNFDAEQLAAEVEHPENLPGFIARILAAYADPENADYDDVDTSLPFDKNLFEAYYRQCAHSSSSFLRKWSGFDSSLRNVVAAVTARRLERPVAECIIGDNEITQSLTKSSAADFGLRGELVWIDKLLAALADDANMLEKEHRIDMIRWAESDELTVFDYFNLDAVLAYLVKINLVHRWSALDVARGREMFERLTASLSARDRIDSAAAADSKL